MHLCGVLQGATWALSSEFVGKPQGLKPPVSLKVTSQMTGQTLTLKDLIPHFGGDAQFWTSSQFSA